METKNLYKVQSRCRTVEKALSIFSTIVTIIFVCCFTGAAIFFIMHSSIDAALAANPELAENLNISFSVFGIDMISNLDRAYAIQMGAACLAAGLGMIFLKISLVFVRKIFRTILEDGTPFSDKVVDTLKKSFVLIVLFVALATGIGIAAIIGLFLWFIYTIFQYGNDLQHLADETL